MGTASEQAALNNASSGIVSDDKPSATKPCPYMKRLRLGVFFDGTGNNKYEAEPKGTETNVVRLFNPYRETSDDQIIRDKLYLIGVGAGSAPTDPAHSDQWSGLQSSSGTSTLFGGAFGKGMHDRLNIAYKWVKAKVQAHSEAFLEDSEKLVDIYGFSRGAAAARTFDNLVVQALKKEAHTRNARVRFLGIFDTVGSTGLPSSIDGTWNPGLNLGLDSGDFLGCRHFTARDEVRANFALTELPGFDTPYAGVHSDVGGGYAPGDQGKKNWLAGPPLVDMFDASVLQGVEFTVARTSLKLPSTMTLADVTKVKADSDIYDGGAEKNTPAAKTWQDTYVHDSTQGWYKGNWARSMTYLDASTGKDVTVKERERLRVPKYNLEGMPPNFSWSIPPRPPQPHNR